MNKIHKISQLLYFLKFSRLSNVYLQQTLIFLRVFLEEQIFIYKE